MADTLRPAIAGIYTALGRHDVAQQLLSNDGGPDPDDVAQELESTVDELERTERDLAELESMLCGTCARRWNKAKGAA